MRTIKHKLPLPQFLGLIAGHIMAAIVLSISLSALLALAFQFLWNRAFVPAVRAQQIGYWQAVGLLLIAVIVGSAAKSVSISRNKTE